MIRIVFYLALLFLVTLGAAWMADRPGSVTISWLGYEIQLTVMVAASALILLVFLIMGVWWLIRNIVGMPKFLADLLGHRRRERGLHALTHGMLAVGAGDVRLARRYAEDATRLLDDEPAAFLLKAQAAQLEGNRGAARAAFTAMLDNPETKPLGLRGLFFEAQRDGQADAAFLYAREARDLAPDSAWAGAAVFDYQTAARQWDAALKTLETNAHEHLVDKQTAARQRAVLLTARALELENGDPDKARAYAQEAHKLAPGLIPAAVLAGRLLSRQGDLKRAMKVLETAWQKTPHPELAEGYAHVRPGDSARDRQKRVIALAKMRANHPEGAFAIAQAAIDAQDWDTARKTLDPMLRSAPTQRACLLMAEIEEGQHGDRGRVREWLSRAVHARRDPAWTADGVVSEDWAPISPVTGRLDAFEWKVPVESVAGEGPEAVDDDLLKPLNPIVPVLSHTAAPESAEAKPAVASATGEAKVDDAAETEETEPAEKAEPVIAAEPPAEPDTPEADVPDEAPQETAEAEPAEEDDAASGADAEIVAVETKDDDEDAESETKTEEEEDDPRMVRFPLAHAPDDPGPTKPGAEGTNGRFRLF